MRSLAASGLAVALTASAWVRPSDRDDYPYGYRAEKRTKPRNEKKAAKRKAERRARRITRNSGR
jgi:hypothetical protein